MMNLKYSQLAYIHHHVFFSYSGEETAELDKKKKLTEKPELNDVMNVVAAKIPSKWEQVSITIYIVHVMVMCVCVCVCVCVYVCTCLSVCVCVCVCVCRLVVSLASVKENWMA